MKFLVRAVDGINEKNKKKNKDFGRGKYLKKKHLCQEKTFTLYLFWEGYVW